MQLTIHLFDILLLHFLEEVLIKLLKLFLKLNHLINELSALWELEMILVVEIAVVFLLMVSLNMVPDYFILVVRQV